MSVVLALIGMPTNHSQMDHVRSVCNGPNGIHASELSTVSIEDDACPFSLWVRSRVYIFKVQEPQGVTQRIGCVFERALVDLIINISD